MSDVRSTSTRGHSCGHAGAGEDDGGVDGMGHGRVTKNGSPIMPGFVASRNLVGCRSQLRTLIVISWAGLAFGIAFGLGSWSKSRRVPPSGPRLWRPIKERPLARPCIWFAHIVRSYVVTNGADGAEGAEGAEGGNRHMVPTKRPRSLVAFSSLPCPKPVSPPAPRSPVPVGARPGRSSGARRRPRPGSGTRHRSPRCDAAPRPS